MDVVPFAIAEVKLIKPSRFCDERGVFMQTHHQEQYRNAGIDVDFVQDNWVQSKRGVLRGLHYQLKNPQDKLLFVVRGEAFDVAVDIRRGSPTFGKWVGAKLSEENGYQMFVPKGFAHGIIALTDKMDFVYKSSAFYAPGDQYGLDWNDPEIGIEWPKEIDVCVSDKDKHTPSLSDMPPENLPVYK